MHTPHDPYHPESKLFPPHNVRGSWGREFYGPLAGWYAEHQADSNVTMFDKTRYSSFAGTPLDLWLRERNIHDVHLVGVCTDICVLHTAVDAYNLNYALTIHEAAVATFKPGGQDWALDHFKTVLAPPSCNAKARLQQPLQTRFFLTLGVQLHDGQQGLCHLPHRLGGDDLIGTVEVHAAIKQIRRWDPLIGDF